MSIDTILKDLVKNITHDEFVSFGAKLHVSKTKKELLAEILKVMPEKQGNIIKHNDPKYQQPLGEELHPIEYQHKGFNKALDDVEKNIKELFA